MAEIAGRRRAHRDLPFTSGRALKIPTDGVGLAGEGTKYVLLVGNERDVVIRRVAAAAPETKL